MVNEGDEAYTTNLCQMRFNKHLQAKGEEPLIKCEVEAGCGKEGVSGRGMWEHFSSGRSKAKKYRQLADEEKQAGILGQWQQESPAREYLEQVKCCFDTVCNESMMKKGFHCLKRMGTWEECQENLQGKKMRASEWAFDRMKEAFDLAAKGRGRKMSIV